MSNMFKMRPQPHTTLGAQPAQHASLTSLSTQMVIARMYCFSLRICLSLALYRKRKVLRERACRGASTFCKFHSWSMREVICNTGPRLPSPGTMRLGSTAKVLANRVLKNDVTVWSVIYQEILFSKDFMVSLKHMKHFVSRSTESRTFS